jgi:hypothetical protein
MRTSGQLNVCEFGAVGDGNTDDTAAIQKALEAAAEEQATVYVPPGTFRAAGLKMHSNTGLAGDPAWSYRDFGGSIMQLADPEAPCLLDVTGAVGISVNGLCLDGGRPRRAPGDGHGTAHGILMDKPDTGEQEDHIRVERCRIGNFGGDGIRLTNVWCWTVRHSMVCFNGGSALNVHGWDGFLLDSWLSGNVGAGIRTDEAGASTTITANRIEWNREGGIVVRGGKHYNITGNFIDRSGKSGIRLASTDERSSEVFTITGNVIWRSGRPEWVGDDPHDSSQVRFEDTAGLTFTGNTLNVWRDDGPRGEFSPRLGVVARGLADSVIRNNALHGGALEKLLVDLGGHGGGVIIADNPGRLFVPPDE